MTQTPLDLWFVTSPNMKKLLALLLLFGIIGCEPSNEVIKNRIDKLHAEIQLIPATEPCTNLNRYKKLKALEEKFNTSYLLDVTNKKIEDYESRCFDKGMLDTLGAERFNEYKANQKFMDRYDRLQKLGGWSIGDYVDRFGDDTGEKFLVLATNSGLKTKVTIPNASLDRNISLKLYQNNSSTPMKTKYSLYCDVKAQDGSIYSLTLYQQEYWDDFELDNQSGIKRFKESIKKAELVKFSCTNGTSFYKFQIDFNNFLQAVDVFNEWS